MSWRFRSYQSKFYFSEKDIDFTTEKLDYEQFLLQEFFTADFETRKKISDFYNEVYGSRSFAYLKSKYSEWANGNYHLTDMMRERILSLMPNFLNDNAKHKLGIHEFMASIKKTIKSFEYEQSSRNHKTRFVNNINDITSEFDQEFDKILNLKFNNLRFNILSEEEKSEALDICKFILEVKLQNLFDQIEGDLNVFLPELFKNRSGDILAKYLIKKMNLELVISDYSFKSISMPKFKIYEVELNSRFNYIANKYLAYEVLSLNSKFKIGAADTIINLLDVNLFFKEYDKLIKLDGEVKVDSKFQGQGGTLVLEAYFKPESIYLSEITTSGLKIAGYGTIICIMFTASAKFNILDVSFMIIIPLSLSLGSKIFTEFWMMVGAMSNFKKSKGKKKNQNNVR